MKRFFYLLVLLLTVNISYSQIIETNEYTKSTNIPIEVTDLDGNRLNKNNLYKIQLITKNTGTRESYLAWFYNRSWQIRAVEINDEASNHSLLIIDDVLRVKKNHKSFYSIRVFVKKYINKEAEILLYVLDGDYQWKCYQNDHPPIF